jgi:hypothetical protein
MPTYADHYGPTPVPESVYEGWATPNVQLVTGAKTPTPTKIVVVDLDGPEAVDAWHRIAYDHGYGANTGWIATTGSGGRHYYFRLPDGTAECQSGLLWALWDTYGTKGKGDWAKHKEIRLIADNALIVAPPSVHVDTGRRYEFNPKFNPNRVRLPEVAPAWLLAKPRLSRPRFGPEPPKPAPAAPRRPFSGAGYTREEVLDAVGGQKFDVATREWGLVAAATAPNPHGWVSCYVPGREDPRHSRPSGSFHWADGTFQDRKDLTTVSFFDLGVLLGHFHDWRECRDALGDRFVGRGKEATHRYVY